MLDRDQQMTYCREINLQRIVVKGSQLLAEEVLNAHGLGIVIPTQIAHTKPGVAREEGGVYEAFQQNPAHVLDFVCLFVQSMLGGEEVFRGKGSFLMAAAKP